MNTLPEIDKPQLKPPTLWQNADFMKLWVGQTVSELGSRITRDGLPLLAVTTLGANAFQMGLLSAAGMAPVLLVSLFAGVWVDRVRRKPILMGADIGRAVLLLAIPLLALVGVLNIVHLMVISALVGILTVFFGIAYRAYLPTLVERAQIVEGNSRLSLSDSAAELAGPGLAGVLIQALTAPVAIFIDALTFIVSVVSLGLIRKPEQVVRSVEERQPVKVELQEGLRAVTGQPLLRSLAAASATDSFFGNFIGVLYGLYAIRELGLGPAMLGFTIAMGGASSIVGAIVAAPLLKRVDLGPALIGLHALRALATLLIPLAGGEPAQAVLFLIAAQLSGDGMMTVFSIHSVSLVQSITPDRLLGRVNGSLELLAAGIGPFGALVGGFLGGMLGSRPTLLIASIGIGLSTFWLIFSPIRKLREFPTRGDSTITG